MATRPWSGGRTRYLSAVLAILAGLPLFGLAAAPESQQTFSPTALGARVPIVRQEKYRVNARVRPLALFWISRDDVGDARLTWREGQGGRKAFELLVGSDPSRTPRHINRWGFLVEEAHAGTVEVLGLIKGSSEETLDEAAANVEKDGKAVAGSLFGAVRSTVTRGRAESGTLTFRAPQALTYRDLEALLGLMPSAPRDRHTVELPAEAKEGFLLAMTSMMPASAAPCRDGRGAEAVRPVIYFYKRALYDLTLQSCSFAKELRTSLGVHRDIVDGRFEVKNRTTSDVTRFQVAFGTTASLRDVPVRIVFRPRWWMEAELLLDRSENVP